MSETAHAAIGTPGPKYRVLAKRDGTTILVRSTGTTAQSSSQDPRIVEQSTRSPEQLLKQLQSTIPVIAEAVRAAGETIASPMRDVKLKEIELEFGLTASAELDAWVVELSGEAALTVRVLWEKTPAVGASH